MAQDERDDDVDTDDRLEVLVERLLTLEADRKTVAKSFRDQIKEVKHAIEELMHGA